MTNFEQSNVDFVSQNQANTALHGKAQKTINSLTQIITPLALIISLFALFIGSFFIFSTTTINERIIGPKNTFEFLDNIFYSFTTAIANEKTSSFYDYVPMIIMSIALISNMVLSLVFLILALNKANKKQKLTQYSIFKSAFLCFSIYFITCFLINTLYSTQFIYVSGHLESSSSFPIYNYSSSYLSISNISLIPLFIAGIFIVIAMISKLLNDYVNNAKIQIPTIIANSIGIIVVILLTYFASSFALKSNMYSQGLYPSVGPLLNTLIISKINSSDSVKDLGLIMVIFAFITNISLIICSGFLISLFAKKIVFYEVNTNTTALSFASIILSIAYLAFICVFAFSKTNKELGSISIFNPIMCAIFGIFILIVNFISINFSLKNTLKKIMVSQQFVNSEQAITNNDLNQEIK